MAEQVTPLNVGARPLNDTDLRRIDKELRIMKRMLDFEDFGRLSGPSRNYMVLRLEAEWKRSSSRD